MRLARIGLPATSTKTGFVCTDGKIRTAIQLDFGTSTSKLSGRVCAVGDDLLPGDRVVVDDDLNRHLPRVADPRPLDVPVRLLIEPRVANFLRLRRRLLLEPGGHVERHLHLARLARD